MLVTTQEMFKQAQEGGFAIPSANFLDYRMAKAFVQVAEAHGMPLILSFAQSHMKELDIIDAASIGIHLAQNSRVPIALHLDHGEDKHTIEKAVSLGFTSVMIDASKQPFTENIAITKEIVDIAHHNGVVVEAELGHVGSGDTLESATLSDSIYTEPAQAREFCRKTGVDSLAVSIGTAHGHYKGVPKINFEALAQIGDQVEIPLVLHGGSGSGDDNLHKCAISGIRKINIFTDFITAAHSAIYAEKHDNMLTLNRLVSSAYAETLAHYYRVFATQAWRA